MFGRVLHCVKSVHIGSFYRSYFLSAFGLNKERYGVFIRIQSEYGKTRTRKTPNTDIFHAVLSISLEYQWKYCTTSPMSTENNS